VILLWKHVQGRKAKWLNDPEYMVRERQPGNFTSASHSANRTIYAFLKKAPADHMLEGCTGVDLETISATLGNARRVRS
jgi:hypothetical protein